MKMPTIKLEFEVLHYTNKNVGEVLTFIPINAISYNTSPPTLYNISNDRETLVIHKSDWILKLKNSDIIIKLTDEQYNLAKEEGLLNV